MDKDEFYDSLDGDLSSPSNTSLTSQNFEEKSSPNQLSRSSSVINFLVIKPPPESHSGLNSKQSSNSSLSSEFESKCNIYKGKNIVNNNDEQKTNDLSNIVPLYTGEKTICEINKIRKCSSTSTLTNSNFSKLTHCQKSQDDGSNGKKENSPRKQRFRKKTLQNDSVQIQQIRSKSYLKIFHNRIGYPTSAKKTKETDTTRSTCGDTKRSSLTSMLTERDEFVDAEDNQLETASYYFKAIAESQNPKTPCSARTFSSNSTSFHMASLSEIFSQKEIPKTKKSTRRYTSSKLPPIPTLGGLGPDTVRNQEKMELRKKQLSYGQKASYKNRIKLLEMNILKNLKSEIDESNSAKNNISK